MSDRNYQVGFCKRCLNRKEDFKQGFLCNITGEKASFEKECPDFKEDVSVKVADEKEKNLTPDEVKSKLRADDYERLRLEQNFLRGITGGIIGGAISVILWVAITVATKYQIGYMAIAVGFIVGYAIRICGKGVDKIFGISGAVIAFLACLIGNFMSLVVFTVNMFNAEGYSVGYFEIFQYIDISKFISEMKGAFRPIDLLFYGLAIAEGYKFSFRKITEKDIENLARK